MEGSDTLSLRHPMELTSVPACIWKRVALSQLRISSNYLFSPSLTAPKENQPKKNTPKNIPTDAEKGRMSAVVSVVSH